MVMDVNYAQLVLDHLVIIDHVFHWNVKKIKSSDQIWNAHNVNGVQQDHFPTLQEQLVLYNQDQQSMLVVFQVALNSKYLILIDLNVFLAQITL